MNKIALFSLLLMVFPFGLLGSDARINAPLVETGEILSEISGAVGWYRNDAGQWCQHVQKIADCTESGEYGYSNFTRLQLRRVSTADGDLIALVSSYKQFKYVYPNIRMGQIEIEPTRYGVFSVDELRNTLRDEPERPYLAAYKIKYWGYFEDWGEDILQREISAWVNGAKEYAFHRFGLVGFLLWPVEVNGERFMRFSLETCTVGSKGKMGGCQPTYAWRAGMEERYYEIPYDEFASFINTATEKMQLK